MLIDLLVILVAGAAFAGVWVLLSNNGARPFIVAWLSFVAGLLVWVLRSFLGIPLG